MFDNFLLKALFISLTVHTIFICSSLAWQMPKAKSHERSKRVEISYRPPQPKKATPDVSERPIKPAQKLDLKNTTSSLNGSIPLKLAKENAAMAKTFYDRKPEQIRSMQMPRRIVIKPVKSEKINNSAYAVYSEMVRNHIKQKVTENYHHIGYGTVYLTFIVAADGTLKASQIIEEKTNASVPLKESALDALHQCRFTPFLKGMTLPEYSFNIEIQYLED